MTTTPEDEVTRLRTELAAALSERDRLRAVLEETPGNLATVVMATRNFYGEALLSKSMAARVLAAIRSAASAPVTRSLEDTEMKEGMP